MRLPVWLAALVLSACVALPRYLTPSGKPEVFVGNMSRAALINKIAAACVNTGYRVARVDDFIVDCRRSNGGAAAVADRIVYGTPRLSEPEERALFNVVETQDGFRVVMTVLNVINPGTAREKTDDNTLFPSDHARRLQTALGLPGPVRQ